MDSLLLRLYKKIVIERPILSLMFLFLVVAFFAFHAQNFKLDASAESLVLENDEDLR